MFTGLVQKVGCLKSIARSRQGARLRVEHSAWDDGLAVGESVSVQGVCLTVACLAEGGFECDLLDETLRKTSLGAKSPGDRLNLERALRPSDRLGGHFVTGHVDGVGTVSGVDRKGADHVMAIACSSDLLGDMVPKGAVALDGVSLTLVEVKTTAFTVHLIPTTRTQTTLGDAKPGQTVNIETDVLAKYVRRSVGGAPSGTPLSMADLARAGFVEG